MYKIARQNNTHAKSISPLVKEENEVRQLCPLMPIFSLSFFTFKARRKLKGIPAKNWTKSLEEIRAGKDAKRFSSHIDLEKDRLANDLDGNKRTYLEIKGQHKQ